MKDEGLILARRRPHRDSGPHDANSAFSNTQSIDSEDIHSAGWLSLLTQASHDRRLLESCHRRIPRLSHVECFGARVAAACDSPLRVPVPHPEVRCVGAGAMTVRTGSAIGIFLQER